MEEIQLGMLVADRLTGFKGTATGKCIWLYGMTTFHVQPFGLTKDGSTTKALWVEAERLEVILDADTHLGAMTSPPDA